MKYRAEIDGLRALAVLPVIFFHAGFELFSGGFVGVDVFFVISGYLITTIIVSELDEDKFSLVNFYERRARRILPALFFVMIACIPFALLWLSPSDLKDFGQSLVSTATFSSNVLFWWERGYFGPALELKPLLHTWSLSVEEQYYIIFPVMLASTWKFGIKKITIFLILVFCISLSTAHVASIYGIFDRIITASFYLIPTRAWEILLGVFVAIYFHNYKPNQLTKFNQIFSLLGLFMIVYAIIFFNSNTPFPSLYTLVPTVGTALIIISAQSNTFVNKILSTKYLVFMGLLSYSAYLWHQPIFAFARHRMSHETSDQLFLALIVLSISLAYISWKWVEKPFRNKNRISGKAIFTFSVAGMLVFISLGSALSSSNGLLLMYGKVEQEIYKEFMAGGDYNNSHMKSLNAKRFDQSDNRKKLLVIGDSYAGDLVNSIKESNLESDYQLSTYRIPVTCGVLFVERELISKFQPHSCSQMPNFFNEPLLKTLLIEADEIWIESSWQQWQIQFLFNSLARLKKINSKIILFGTKTFPITSASEYRNNYGVHGLTREFDISTKQKLLSRELRSIAESLDIEFIDPMLIICGSDKVCRHSFDNEGIISVDGAHLTPYGAKYFGFKLDQYINSDKFSK